MVNDHLFYDSENTLCRRNDQTFMLYTVYAIYFQKIYITIYQAILVQTWHIYEFLPVKLVSYTSQFEKE